jgi:thiol-disulfide isomerase/thioredoxin
MAGFFTTVLLSAPLLLAQVSESSIEKQISKLRSLSPTQRPAATAQIALDIRKLPPGMPKLQLADGLSHLATEGDAGTDVLQTVLDTLAQSLSENPIPAKGDRPAMPYMDVARYVRYANLTTSFTYPQLTKADQILAANDADIEKADFTLKDLKGKKVTLSELRGKIVLVNFWATWCPPCRVEMPGLDAIYTHYQSQGLVILSITDEDAYKIFSTLGQMNYHAPILFDPGGKVHKQFHIEGIPKSFVYNREGKLVAQSLDECTPRQFLRMLGKAGLHD